MSKIRLDKYLSAVGVGTRTEVKKLIRIGRVTINEEVVKDPSMKVSDSSENIQVSGETILFQKFVYLMLNKPEGVVSATEDKRDETVIDLIKHPMKHKLFPVGRLDKDTTGLLLLTNDGSLAHDLLSPKKHVNKTYEAKILGMVNEDTIKAFKKGIKLEDGYTCMPAELILCNQDQDFSYTKVMIAEGKFHQIKRMFLSVDMKVITLKRVAMGPVVLDEELDLGQVRELTKGELQKLRG